MSGPIIPDEIIFAVAEGCGDVKFLVVPNHYVRVHIWLNPGKSWHDAEAYFDGIARREEYTRCAVVPDCDWDGYWPGKNISISP